jgi:hypothetical protein
MAAVPLATLTAGVQQHQRWPQVTPIVALILARPLAQHPFQNQRWSQVTPIVALISARPLAQHLLCRAQLLLLQFQQQQYNFQAQAHHVMT